MKALKISILGLGIMSIATLVFFACQKSVSDSPTVTSAGGKPATLDPLTLTCNGSTPASITLHVCAGASGASAGFSVQWITLADFQKGPDGVPGTSDDNTWSSSVTSYRCVSLSGVPGCAGSNKYSLGANACVDVVISDDIFDHCGESAECGDTRLSCGTTYVFRAFAHNIPGGLKASDKSGTIQCSTGACGNTGNCTFTQGYWKTHGPDGCRTGNNTNNWPASVLNSGLFIGNDPYTADQLCTILNTSAQGGTNYALAHQLIAALINQANGADVSSVQACIDVAQNYFKTHTLGAKNDGTENTQCLDDFNQGTTGPGHCPE